MNFTIADGFKLGCGLLLALASAVSLLLVAVSAAALVSTLLGIRLPLPGA